MVGRKPTYGNALVGLWRALRNNTKSKKRQSLKPNKTSMISHRKVGPPWGSAREDSVKIRASYNKSLEKNEVCTLTGLPKYRATT